MIFIWVAVICALSPISTGAKTDVALRHGNTTSYAEDAGNSSVQGTSDNLDFSARIGAISSGPASRNDLPSNRRQRTRDDPPTNIRLKPRADATKSRRLAARSFSSTNRRSRLESDSSISRHSSPRNEQPSSRRSSLRDELSAGRRSDNQNEQGRRRSEPRDETGSRRSSPRDEPSASRRTQARDTSAVSRRESGLREDHNSRQRSDGGAMKTSQSSPGNRYKDDHPQERLYAVDKSYKDDQPQDRLYAVDKSYKVKSHHKRPHYIRPDKCHPQTITKYRTVYKKRNANVYNKVEVRNPRPQVIKTKEIRYTTIRYPVFITQVHKPKMFHTTTHVKPIFTTTTLLRSLKVVFTQTGYFQVTTTVQKYENEYITRCHSLNKHKRPLIYKRSGNEEYARGIQEPRRAGSETIETNETPGARYKRSLQLSPSIVVTEDESVLSFTNPLEKIL